MYTPDSCTFLKKSRRKWPWSLVLHCELSTASLNLKKRHIQNERNIQNQIQYQHVRHIRTERHIQNGRHIQYL